ncbi:MAG: redoxin family protein [Alkalimonas sp.]|nr:redoxin family protein [Alkalimonas sp.]
MRKWLFFAPLAIFLAVSVFLYTGLFSDPWSRDSALLNRPMPEFDLPDLMQPQQRWNRELLTGEPFLLSVWGVWCPTCKAQLRFMTELREQGIPIIGLYYPLPVDPAFGDHFSLGQLQRDVQRELAYFGDPYQFNILDENRRLSFDLGVSGSPETFLVDADGTIRMHHVGDMNPRVWRNLFATAFEELQQAALVYQEVKP